MARKKSCVLLVLLRLHHLVIYACRIVLHGFREAVGQRAGCFFVRVGPVTRLPDIMERVDGGPAAPAAPAPGETTDCKILSIDKNGTMAL